MDNVKTFGELKRIREANAVAVGGMIAFGKSTLVEGLAKYYSNSEKVYEMIDDDPLQQLLLKSLYDRTVPASVFQLYFVTKRFEIYKKALMNNQHRDIVFFDRTIFEDRLFAHQNMLGSPIEFSYYDKFWNDLTNELIYSIGVPKLYIFLDGDFNLFKQRIFKRNRSVEIENWDKNADYFKNLHEAYPIFMEGICKKFGIKMITINVSNKNEEEVLQDAIAAINKEFPSSTQLEHTSNIYPSLSIS